MSRMQQRLEGPISNPEEKAKKNGSLPGHELFIP